MIDETREIEIDGKRFTVDRTFDNSPAIYRAKSFHSLGHIDSKPGLYEVAGTPVEPDCVLIIARAVSVLILIALLCVSASAQNLTRPAITPPKPDTTWNWQFKESSALFIGSFTLDCLSSTDLIEHSRLLRNSHGGVRMGGCFVANGAAYGLTVLLQRKHPKIANWMRRVGAAAHFGAAAHNFAVKGGRR